MVKHEPELHITADSPVSPPRRFVLTVKTSGTTKKIDFDKEFYQWSQGDSNP
jgi:hypothetical protein